MALDEKLAARVRSELASEETLEEIKMFGGICFKLNDKMACGILGDDLIVKVDPERYDELMRKPNTKGFDFTRRGKPMRGMVVVEPAGVMSASSLRFWVRLGADYAKGRTSKRRKRQN